MEPLSDVWRTEDRLHTDDATIALLFDLASRDAAIREVIRELRSPRAGNGSVWATGTARRGRTPAVLKLGARRSERDWMSAVDAAPGDVVPRVFGRVSCAASGGSYSSGVPSHWTAARQLTSARSSTRPLAITALQRRWRLICLR